MGYGDIVPVTNAERLFTLGVALVGAVVFSYCMGSVASLITQARAHSPRYALHTLYCQCKLFDRRAALASLRPSSPRRAHIHTLT